MSNFIVRTCMLYDKHTTAQSRDHNTHIYNIESRFLFIFKTDNDDGLSLFDFASIMKGGADWRRGRGVDSGPSGPRFNPQPGRLSLWP